MHQNLPLRSVYTQKGFNNFIQSVVEARRAEDKNPELSVAAETRKLLGRLVPRVTKTWTEADIQRQNTRTMKRQTKLSTGNCLRDLAVCRKKYAKLNL